MIKQRNSPNNLLLLVAVRSRADVYFLEIICSEEKKKKKRISILHHYRGKRNAINSIFSH